MAEMAYRDARGQLSDRELWEEIFDPSDLPPPRHPRPYRPWPAHLRNRARATETKNYDEALHPRDERGRWASGNAVVDALNLSQTIDGREINATNDLKPILSPSNWTPTTPGVKAATAGMQEAMDAFASTHPGLADYIHEHVTVGFMDNEAMGQALVATPHEGGIDRAVFLVNTHDSPDATLTKAEQNPGGTIGTQWATAILARGGSRDEAIQALYRSVVEHEMGHVVDYAVARRATDEAWGATREEKMYGQSATAALARRYRELAERESGSSELLAQSEYIQNLTKTHLSDYASNGGKEAWAEAFSAYRAGRLPATLRDTVMSQLARPPFASPKKSALRYEIDSPLTAWARRQPADWIETESDRSVDLKYSDSQPRDDHGRWTSGGDTFVSPSIHDQSLGAAVEALHGERQRLFEQASREVDAALGLKGKQSQAIGAWKDGAENTTLFEAKTATLEQLRLSAAMKGDLGNQKAVVVFKQSTDGKAALYDLTVKGDVNAVHEALIAEGVRFHTLVSTAAGTRVLIVDLDHSLHASTERFADAHNTTLLRRFGHAEFIGDEKGTGSDADQRARGSAAYHAVIGAARTAYGGRSALGLYGRIRDRYRAAITAAKAFIAQQALIAAWVRAAAVSEPDWWRTKWDESQPRDERGRWTSDGSAAPIEGRTFTSDEGYAWHEHGPVDEWAKGLSDDEKRVLSDYAGFGYGDVNALRRGTYVPPEHEVFVRDATPEEIARLGSRMSFDPPKDPKSQVADGYFEHNVFNVGHEYSIRRREPNLDRLKDVQEHADRLDRLIADKGYVLPETIQVERAAYLPGVTFENLKDMPDTNAVYTEHGFSSTMVGNANGRMPGYVAVARDESLYNRFGKVTPRANDGVAVRFTIEIPKGTKVASIEAVRRLQTGKSWSKNYRSESELLLGSGARFQVVHAEHGPNIRSGTDLPVPSENVHLRYIGGGSSDGGR